MTRHIVPAALVPAALLLVQGIMGAEAKAPTSCDKLGEIVAALQGPESERWCKDIRKTEDTVQYVTVPTQTQDVVVTVTKADCGATPAPEPPAKFAAGDGSSNKLEALKGAVDKAALQAQKDRLQADIDEKRAKIATIQKEKASKPEDVAKRVAKLAEDISEKTKELERISRLLSGSVNAPRAISLPTVGGGSPTQQGGVRLRVGGSLWDAVRKLLPGTGAGELDVELDSIQQDLAAGLAGLSLPSVPGKVPRQLPKVDESFGKSFDIKLADGKITSGSQQDAGKIFQDQTARFVQEIRDRLASLAVGGNPKGNQARGISPPTFKDGKLTQEFGFGKGVKIGDGTISDLAGQVQQPPSAPDAKFLEDLSAILAAGQTLKDPLTTMLGGLPNAQSSGDILKKVADGLKNVGPRGVNPPTFNGGKLVQTFDFSREFKIDDKTVGDLVAQLKALLPGGGGKINTPRGVSPPTFKNGQLSQDFSLEKGVALDDKAISDLIAQLQTPQPNSGVIRDAVARLGRGQPDTSAIQGIITRLSNLPATIKPVQDAVAAAIAQFGQLRPGDKAIQDQIAKFKLPQSGPAPSLPAFDTKTIQDQLAKIKLPQTGPAPSLPAFDTKDIQDQIDLLRETTKQFAGAIKAPRDLVTLGDASDPSKGKLDKSITLEQSAKLDQLVQSTIARLQAAVEKGIAGLGAGRLQPVNLSLLGVGRKVPRQWVPLTPAFTAAQIREACACLPPLQKVEVKNLLAQAQPAVTKTYCVVG